MAEGAYQLDLPLHADLSLVDKTRRGFLLEARATEAEERYRQLGR